MHVCRSGTSTSSTTTGWIWSRPCTRTAMDWFRDDFADDADGADPVAWLARVVPSLFAKLLEDPLRARVLALAPAHLPNASHNLADLLVEGLVQRIHRVPDRPADLERTRPPACGRIGLRRARRSGGVVDSRGRASARPRHDELHRRCRLGLHSRACHRFCAEPRRGSPQQGQQVPEMPDWGKQRGRSRGSFAGGREDHAGFACSAGARCAQPRDDSRQPPAVGHALGRAQEVHLRQPLGCRTAGPARGRATGAVHGGSPRGAGRAVGWPRDQ